MPQPGSPQRGMSSATPALQAEPPTLPLPIARPDKQAAPRVDGGVPRLGAAERRLEVHAVPARPPPPHAHRRGGRRGTGVGDGGTWALLRTGLVGALGRGAAPGPASG